MWGSPDYGMLRKGFTLYPECIPWLFPGAGVEKPVAQKNWITGTGGRTRTGTLLRAGDFESFSYNHFSVLIDAPKS